MAGLETIAVGNLLVAPGESKGTGGKFATGEITTTDIAALTRHATESGLGGEFALIRTAANERQLIQLGRMGGDLPNDATRLILHSHPGGLDAIRFGVRGEDVAALATLEQRYFFNVNSEGTVARFGPSGEAIITKQYFFGGWRYP